MRIETPPTPEFMAKKQSHLQSARDAKGNETGALSARYAYRLAVRTDDWEWLCLNVLRLHNVWLMRTGYGGASWDHASGEEPSDYVERAYNVLLRGVGYRVTRLVWLCNALNDGEDVARLRANLDKHSAADDDLLALAQKILDAVPRKC
jgi:hypothetical protein